MTYVSGLIMQPFLLKKNQMFKISALCTSRSRPSLFVDNEAEGDVPDHAETIKRLQKRCSSVAFG